MCQVVVWKDNDCAYITGGTTVVLDSSCLGAKYLCLLFLTLTHWQFGPSIT